MDGNRFDALTMALVARTAPRRAALRLLAGGALAAPLAWLGVGTVAGQDAADHLGCRHERQRCARGRQCCSGVCKRKRCRRARGQGTCQGENSCFGVVTCNDDPDCQCHVTTRGTSFCGDNLGRGCVECATNRDCRDAGFPPGSVCADCPGCDVSGGTICLAPCG